MKNRQEKQKMEEQQTKSKTKIHNNNNNNNTHTHTNRQKKTKQNKQTNKKKNTLLPSFLELERLTGRGTLIFAGGFEAPRPLPLPPSMTKPPRPTGFLLKDDSELFEVTLVLRGNQRTTTTTTKSESKCLHIRQENIQEIINQAHLKQRREDGVGGF